MLGLPALNGRTGELFTPTGPMKTTAYVRRSCESFVCDQACGLFKWHIGRPSTLTRTRMLLAAYPKKTKQEAKRHGLQAVQLPARHEQVPAALHQALWDLLAGASTEPPEQVLQAVHELTDAVQQDIWSAWMSVLTQDGTVCSN